MEQGEQKQCKIVGKIDLPERMPPGKVTTLEIGGFETSVREECIRINKKFGEQNHDPFKYLAILGEEIGEANKAAVDAYDFKLNTFGGDRRAALGHLKVELVQCAAVIRQFLECIDRNKWK